MSESDLSAPATTAARIGIAIGPLLFVAMLLASPPDGMPVPAWRTAAVGTLMAAWWITEAIPIPATALLPIMLFPVLGIAKVEAATAPYGNSVIYLFLGGFLLAVALESSGLHRRLALAILSAAGTRPANLVLGFMIATAGISMWVSNTATVMMMLPLATSVMALSRGGDAALASAARPLPASAPASHFEVALLLSIAYAASIGGLGTLIGTPPNALLAGFMAESYGVRIGFVEWMMLGVPIVAISIPVAWLLLTRWLYPVGHEPIAGGDTMLREQRETLGRATPAERVVGTVVALTAVAWVARPIIERWIPAVTDTGIAITGALLLFIVPVSWRPHRVVLTWKQAERLPWSVLVLFGGGLSLAAAIQDTGLAKWIGTELGGIAGWPVFAMILVITTIVIFLTELTSNTAVAATFLPIVGSVAVGMGADPMLLTIPAALAASCAFMLPVGTPPNALVYASGQLTIPQMARAGWWLNVFFVLLLPLVVYYFAGRIFGF